MTDLFLRRASALLAMSAASVMLGCGPDPPPQPEDLTAAAASTLISQKWAHDELNHFTVTFHSDTLIACGVQNDLWKRVETPYQGATITRYDLTEAGHKA